MMNIQNILDREVAMKEKLQTMIAGVPVVELQEVVTIMATSMVQNANRLGFNVTITQVMEDSANPSMGNVKHLIEVNLTATARKMLEEQGLR